MNGSWKIVSGDSGHRVSQHINHFVEEKSATSLCGIVTLDFIMDQKWLPNDETAHLCGKCQELGAEISANGCQCPICKNPTTSTMHK